MPEIEDAECSVEADDLIQWFCAVVFDPSRSRQATMMSRTTSPTDQRRPETTIHDDQNKWDEMEFCAKVEGEFTATNSFCRETTWQVRGNVHQAQRPVDTMKFGRY